MWRLFYRKVWTRRLLRFILLLLFCITLIDGIYLYSRVPDWSMYANGAIPKSNFMRRYEQRRAGHRDWPALRWHPISLRAMPKHLRRAAVVAEDSRFYEHGGFDLIAFREAMELNLKRNKLTHGASTISQQTVKNLFLSPARDPLRKWHELVLTLIMEQRLSKARILEIYLNIAEFGRGIYGVEAAARHYFDKHATDLTLTEAAELAASLPSPIKSNPATRSNYFIRHRDTILARITPSHAPEAGLPILELELTPSAEEEPAQADALDSHQQALELTAPGDIDDTTRTTGAADENIPTTTSDKPNF